MASTEDVRIGKPRPGEETEEPEEEEPDAEPDEREDDDDIDEEELGIYESFDWTDQPFVSLTEKARNHLSEMCRNCAKRDMAARRMEVEQAWEARLFDRGYQYLFPRRGGGWQLFSAASGKTWSQMQGAQVYETNIYGAHNEILTSALTRDIPAGRFKPADPDCDADITAAEVAEDYKEVFALNNDLKQAHARIANLLCTDGRVVVYTTYRLDGQRFGFDSDRDETAAVPETDNPRDTIESTPSGRPRGREIIEVFGKLENKVPIQAQDINDCDFCQLHWDVDENRAKAKFPWIEEKIKPSGSVGEIGIDRIARINVCLALEGGYVTGDTFNRQITITYTWLRPASFYQIKDREIRKEFIDNFPQGCMAAHAGDELAFCRNECMDDHLQIVQALQGNGQNRRGLTTNNISGQKRLNNWLDLLNDFFVRTVPTVWMDSDVFNVSALAKTNNVPGQRRPFVSIPGRQVAEMIYAEPLPQHQPELPNFIMLFFKDFPEMLSGALPSLFGAESNTDTVGGISIQRDQALGRLGGPWARIQACAATYLRQAVQLAARCRLKRGDSKISWLTDESRKMTIEVSDLKGNVLCFPDADSNFPETWIQRASRYQALFTEAQASPLAMQILGLPENQRIAKDAIGLKDLLIPAAASVDKQRGEFDILLKRRPAPMPNPDIQEGLDRVRSQETQAIQEGPEAYAQFMQTAQAAIQQIEGFPPLISSCPVAKDASEDHATEAETCLSWMNSPKGRKLKLGTPREQKAYQNVHLHWQEHTQMALQLNPPGAANQRPPSISVSASVDRMPNEVAADLLNKFYGVQTSPEAFGEQQAADTEADITKRVAGNLGRPRPSPTQTPGQQSNA